MNFLQGVQRLHRESRRSTAAPTAIAGASERNQRLIDAYADAWREIQSARDDWKWMRAAVDAPLVVGQMTYTAAQLGVSTGFGRWRREDSTYWPSLYISGATNSLWPLDFMNLDCFRDEYVYRTQGSTTPIAWTIDENEQFLVAPAPAVAYRLRADYRTEPTELTVDADTPNLPDRFELLPMWRALQDIATTDGASDILAKANRNYGDMWDKILFDQAMRLPRG